MFHATDASTSLSGASTKVERPTVLWLAALGVVYGDIGTSPLYAMRECFHGPHAIALTRANVLGVLSLIFWSLILVISVKYQGFILQADNQGEGGVLSLTSLVAPRVPGKHRRQASAIVLGLFGATLLYADGMITPAISILSAVEGLRIATPMFESYIEQITIAIIIGLFVLQSRGTARVGTLFGPVTLLWFIVLAVLGLRHIAAQPIVLTALNPLHGLTFMIHNGWEGFLVLGAVFLVVTGGEALYADLGHFGARPIRITWFAVVLPALLLNYFGQGAYLIAHPASEGNPFFRMAPTWALYPFVVLATAAAVIASQAVITGAFSLTLQAVQLGYLPRLRVEHTSPEQRGQIYVPSVNWALMIACIGLVIGFHSSSNLAAAYGVSITITMLITSLLFYRLVRDQWKWGWALALGVSGAFLCVDLAFLGANITKIPHGGWFPLLVAGTGYFLMSTWMSGRQFVAHRLRQQLIPLDLYLAELMSDPPIRVPGIAVFMATNPIRTPSALRHNVTHNHVLHEKVIILTINVANIPRVAASARTEIEEIGAGFYRIALNFGYMEEPNVPQELAKLDVPELPIRSAEVSYFLGRETLIPTSRPGLARWREQIFVMLSRNAQRAPVYFRIPSERVIEVGVQIELQ